MSSIRSIALHFEKKVDKETLVEIFAQILGVHSIQFCFLDTLEYGLKNEALVTIELHYSTKGYSTYTCLYFDNSILKDVDDIVLSLTVSQQLDTNVFVTLDERTGVICTPNATTTRSKFDYEVGEDGEEFLALY